MGGTGGVAWCHLRGLGTRYDIKIKTEHFFEKTFFSMKILFSKKYENRKFSKKKSFFEEKISLFFIDFSLKKVTFLKKIFRFFSSRKIFLSNFLFRKNPLTIFWKRIFGRDFFLTYALCDFLSTEHVFEWIPPFRKSVGRYLLGGANLQFAPPLWRSLTEHFKPITDYRRFRAGIQHFERFY